MKMALLKKHHSTIFFFSIFLVHHAPPWLWQKKNIHDIAVIVNHKTEPSLGFLLVMTVTIIATSAATFEPCVLFHGVAQCFLDGPHRDSNFDKVLGGKEII